MAEKTAKALRGAARVLAYGGIAALGLAAVAFVFALVSHGLDWSAGLDWARKLLLLVGALCLITGGCGLFVSGRDRPSDAVTPHEDDTFRMFWHEVGMPWGAAVSLASIDFLVLGTVVDLVYFSVAG